VFGEEKYFVEQPRAEQKSLVPARQAQRTNVGRTLSFVLLESPFTSVSTISRGHPSLVSLDRTNAGLKMLRDEKKYF
jgi:hypothetical protein